LPQVEQYLPDEEGDATATVEAKVQVADEPEVRVDVLPEIGVEHTPRRVEVTPVRSLPHDLENSRACADLEDGSEQSSVNSSNQDETVCGMRLPCLC
jgi:YbbR domain-containing protein